MYVSMHTRMCICKWLCMIMYVCMYVCMYIYVCTVCMAVYLAIFKTALTTWWRTCSSSLFQGRRRMDLITLYIHTYIHTYIHFCHTYIHTYIDRYIPYHTFKIKCMYVWMYVFTYSIYKCLLQYGMFVYVCMCMYVYVFVCMWCDLTCSTEDLGSSSFSAKR